MNPPFLENVPRGWHLGFIKRRYNVPVKPVCHHDYEHKLEQCACTICSLSEAFCPTWRYDHDKADREGDGVAGGDQDRDQEDDHGDEDDSNGNDNNVNDDDDEKEIKQFTGSQVKKHGVAGQIKARGACEAQAVRCVEQTK
ncbi:hypothetical protein MBLNU459_g5522t1 [Dothideomycetes sp. NU459]